MTETDQEVEKLLIEGIKQKYPHHKYIILQLLNYKSFITVTNNNTYNKI